MNRFDVFFDETGEVLYNDHVLGTPPLVVGPASCEPQWEVSLFLPRLVAIILAGASFVKPGSLDRLWSGLSAVIIECGQELLEGRAPGEPDHLIWPRTALSRSNTTAGKIVDLRGDYTRNLGFSRCLVCPQSVSLTLRFMDYLQAATQSNQGWQDSTPPPAEMTLHALISCSDHQSFL